MNMMLQFKYGRFHAYGVSFQFPDGFYLDTEPDFEHQCGIVAWGPHKDFQVVWDFIESGYSPDEMLQKILSPGYGMEPMSDIEPLVLGGLAGYHVFYHSGPLEYYEARFSVENGAQFVLLISTDEKKIKSVLAFPEVEEILCDIRLD